MKVSDYEILNGEKSKEILIDLAIWLQHSTSTWVGEAHCLECWLMGVRR